MEIVLLTGMSGAGKSQAARVLEDVGYYCIDNLPAELIPHFAKLYTRSPGGFTKFAFVVDIRGEQNFEALAQTMETLKANGNLCKTVFLDCTDTVLGHRYKESRRNHPLSIMRGIPMHEAMAEERKLLAPLRQKSDYLIDTTALTPAQLREKLHAILLGGAGEGIVVHCVSFGFKHGILQDADLVFDVRCFRNPYWDAELREKTGLDAEVRDYIYASAESRAFSDRLRSLFDFLMPLYCKEGKRQLTIGIGCTGGKHRSVAFAEDLCRYLQESGYNAIALHRDIIPATDTDR